MSAMSPMVATPPILPGVYTPPPSKDPAGRGPRDSGGKGAKPTMGISAEELRQEKPRYEGWLQKQGGNFKNCTCPRPTSEDGQD